MVFDVLLLYVQLPKNHNNPQESARGVVRTACRTGGPLLLPSPSSFGYGTIHSLCSSPVLRVGWLAGCGGLSRHPKKRGHW